MIFTHTHKRALYRDARRTHTKWFCIARERVPMQRERVLLPTKRFAITVRLVAKGRAWRAGVEAVHGERVCRAVRGTGLPFSYKYIQTTYYTPHYYTHQSTTPHRLHDSLTYGCLTYGCNPYTLTRACTLRLNPSLGLPSARTLRLKR